ncbi:hypothetical protein [Salinicola halophyticus]|uniref:hypothetical protein n=1 Tax=Salinicola halophyticus TaxID=1808881 RepID=UPI003F4745A1
MEQWLNPTPEAIALGLSLCSLAMVYRYLSRTIVLATLVIWSTQWIEWPSTATDVTTTVIALAVTLATLLAVFTMVLEQRLPAWLATSMPPGGRGAEVAVQVAAHPVSGKLQIFHLSRWFEAVLIDPANPPLRDGETVYLIRWEARRAWVSRVRSHTPTPPVQKRWQWQLRHIEVAPAAPWAPRPEPKNLT